MGAKLHLLVPREIVRSVINGTEAKAACGFSKVYTRESVDSAQNGGLKPCKGCLVAVGDDVSKGDKVTLHPAKGWTALLEMAWSLDEAERFRPQVFTIKTGNVTSWQFPPAA